MNIGRRIKSVLKEKNLNVRQLSAKTGIPATTIYSIISRERDSVNTDLLTKIADGLGISWVELVATPVDEFIKEVHKRDDEISAYAEELHKNPELRMLFDAGKGATKEDLQLAAEMLKRMKKEAGYL